MTEWEPQGLRSGCDDRPDLMIMSPTGAILMDLAVVTPRAPSMVRKAQTPLGAAAHAEGNKRRVYDEMAAQMGEGTRFIPAVWESTGAPGKGALEMVEFIPGCGRQRRVQVHP